MALGILEKWLKIIYNSTKRHLPAQPIIAKKQGVIHFKSSLILSRSICASLKMDRLQFSYFHLLPQHTVLLFGSFLISIISLCLYIGALDFCRARTGACWTRRWQAATKKVRAFPRCVTCRLWQTLINKSHDDSSRALLSKVFVEPAGWYCSCLVMQLVGILNTILTKLPRKL